MNEVHRILLETMIDLREIFDSEGIEYYLVGGCAIGSARSGGFIEWDDDVDIVLMQEYEQKLRSALARLDPEKYDVQTPLQGEFLHDFYCVSRRGTSLIGNSTLRYPQGVSVELFVLKNLPSGIRGGMYDLLMHIHNGMRMVAVSRRMPHVLRRAVNKIFLAMSRVMDSMSDGVEPSDDVIVSPRNGFFFRDKMARSMYGRPSDGMLEGERFSFPEDRDRYLRHLYGDYMQLPPEEARKMPHKDVVDLTKDSREYLDL